MEIPKDIDTNCIKAQSFDHLKAMLPIFPWNSSEVDLSSSYWDIFQNIIDLSVGSALGAVYNMATLSIQRLKYRLRHDKFVHRSEHLFLKFRLVAIHRYLKDSQAAHDNSNDNKRHQMDVVSFFCQKSLLLLLKRQLSV